MSISSLGGAASRSYNRLSGLESGLDTETIVKGLTANVQNKITLANRQKQTLTWKRDFYREISSKLTAFNKKYFSSLNTEFQKALGKYSATNSESKYITVTPGTNAIKSNIVIQDIVSLATASKLQSSSPVSKPSEITVDLAKLDILSGKSMKVTLDGIEKNITFSTQTYDTAASVKTELQSLLDNAFGGGRISVNDNGNVLTLTSDGNSIVLGKADIPENDASQVLGFTDGLRNRINLTDTLANITLNQNPGSDINFTINGKEFSFTGSSTMRDVINKVNSSNAGVSMSYSSITDAFTLTSTTTGSGTQINFSDVTGTLLNSIFGSGTFTDGTNAEIKINTNAGTSDPASLTYTTVVKSSNTFDIDGVSYSLLGKAEDAGLENIKINVDYDIDYAVSKVKEFIVDYNDLLKSVTDKLTETKYKGYPPLSDEERKELGSADAALYDAKAKSGLLVNDSYLSSIATSLRSAVTADVKQLTDNSSSIGIALSELGITTGIYSEKGKLNLDEQKLRKALSEKPDGVIKLFTQKSSIDYSSELIPADYQKRNAESGLLYKISDILQNNIRPLTGTLTKLVGVNNNDFTTVYTSKLRTIEDNIIKLNEKLIKEQDRYWAKFTRMETALSELNKKGAWLSQQTMSSQGQ